LVVVSLKKGFILIASLKSLAASSFNPSFFRVIAALYKDVAWRGFITFAVLK